MSKPTRLPSKNRRAAYRANATHSAQNFGSHSRNAATLAVVRLEELDSVAKLRAGAITTHGRVNSQELFALGVQRSVRKPDAWQLFVYSGTNPNNEPIIEPKIEENAPGMTLLSPPDSPKSARVFRPEPLAGLGLGVRQICG